MQKEVEANPAAETEDTRLFYRAGPDNEPWWDYHRDENGQYVIHSAPNRRQRREQSSGARLRADFYRKTRGAARTRTIVYEARRLEKESIEQRTIRW